MTPERWRKIKEICGAVFECKPDERDVLMRELCSGDDELKREVDGLLAESTSSGSLLEGAVWKKLGIAPEDSETEMTEQAAPQWMPAQIACYQIARLIAEGGMNVVYECAEPTAGRAFSHYRILKKVGQGGTGEVFLAEDTLLGRKVALKFLSPEAEQRQNLRARFLVEAKAAASIDHPFVCKVYETSEAGGRGFIAMEFVEGETLAEKLTEGALPFRDALTIAIQISEGVAAAHERNIVHRDLKPGNIMISRTGHVKIMDFGLAKQVTFTATSDSTPSASLQTLVGTLIGTPAYMSPEQIRAERADARSDVFSMGLVFYWMFSGMHPFSKPTVQATMGAILYEHQPTLSSYVPDLPLALSDMVNRMLMKDPSARQVSALEVRDDLTRLSACSTIPAQKNVPSAIAVLPFVNLGSDPGQEGFCNDLTDNLINALSTLSDLKVAARNSSAPLRGTDLGLREIGDRLNVDAVLEGSVRTAAERIRVIVKLVSVQTGYPLWSDRYDRTFGDTFQIQHEIALSIVEKFKRWIVDARSRRINEAVV